ncbi:hypothetical protein ACC676_01145 [Rhizobium ruizarguesonis]
MKTFGIIEIGSNGLRYEVSRCLPDGSIETAFKDTNRHSLISEVNVNKKRITPRFKDTVLTNIRSWLGDARRRGVDSMLVVTTEVGRQLASIDPDFWSREKLVVNVLTEQQEASFSWAACLDRSRPSDQIEGVIDIGNGSMSIVVGDGKSPLRIMTAPLGGERISQTFLETKGSAAALRSLLSHSIGSLDTPNGFQSVTLMGGFATKAAWQILRPNARASYRSEELEGRLVDRASFAKSQKEIYRLISDHGAKAAQVFVDHREPGAWKLMHILASLSVFNILGEMLSVETFKISTRSVRHGIASRQCKGSFVDDITLAPLW